MANQVEISYSVNGNYFENGFYALDNKIDRIAEKYFCKWIGSGVERGGTRNVIYSFDKFQNAEMFLKEIYKFENLKIYLDGNEMMRVSEIKN